jgi:opacity protein-like surface antigen
MRAARRSAGPMKSRLDEEHPVKKILALLFVLGVVAGGLKAGEKFSATLLGSLLIPADSGYKDVYGKSGFYPELKAGYALSDRFYLWAAYGFLGKKGETPVLKLEAKSNQHFLSLGAGYRGMLSGNLGYEAALGLMMVSYKEEAMETSASGTAFGFRADAGLTYALSGPVFAVAELGYLYASDKVEGETVKPGGFKAGLGLGLKF